MADITYQASVEPEGLPGRPYPRMPDEASPASQGAGLARGVENAGDFAQRAYDQATNLARQTQLTNFHNQAQALSLNLITNPDTGAYAKQGQNAFNLGQQYLPQFDQQIAPLIQGIKDPKAQALATGVAGEVRNHLAEQLDTHELQQHKAFAQETSQASLGLAGQMAAANYNHPDIIAANRDTVNFNINSQAQQYGWSPEVTQYNRQRALSEFHGTIIDSMVGQGELSKARSYLYTQAAAGEIDPKAADSLQRMMMAKQEHDLVMNDKIQRDSSNAVLKNGIQMQQNGTLTPQYIEKFHHTLEPQAYEYLYGLVSGKGAETDPHVYAPLIADAMRGKDVSDQAQQALYSHQLSLSDFKGIIEKSQGGRKGYVARGTDYITTSLRPNPMVPDPAGQRATANALDDWRQWTEDNPDATEDQARNTYRQLTDHYSIVSANQGKLFNAVPTHLVGSRIQPDLDATWQATVAAHNAGQMSDGEYLHQSQLITSWKAAQDKEDAAKAAAAKKKPP